MIRGRITAGEFEGLIRTGEIQPGDLVLYSYRSPRTPVQWLIERTQRRLLADLYDGVPVGDGPAPWRLDDAACYTHVGLVYSDYFCAEMTTPECRLVDWGTRLREQDQLWVRRARREDGCPVTWPDGMLVAEHAARDVGTEYPLCELLRYYLWSWGVQKLWLGKRFKEVFTRRESDVCSGRAWWWMRQAGLFSDVTGPDVRPEAWYPARMALSRNWADVALVTIEAECAVSGAATCRASGPTEQEVQMRRTRSVFEAVTAVLLVAVLLMLLSLVTGCVVGLAGARVNVPLPGSHQNMAMDSVNSQGSQGPSAGQQVDGAAAAQDGERVARGAHQVMQTGDATNARSTDTSAADDASTAAGRETSGTVSPANTQTANKAYDVTAGGTALKGTVRQEPEVPLQTE